MQAKAIRKHVRGSAIKMRAVANVVRGKRVVDALDALRFLPHASTGPISLTIKSAYHNLLDQAGDDRPDESALYVREIRIDEGPMFKRFQAAPRGRGAPILKRTSHITVVVAEADAEA